MEMGVYVAPCGLVPRFTDPPILGGSNSNSLIEGDIYHGPDEDVGSCNVFHSRLSCPPTLAYPSLNASRPRFDIEGRAVCDGARYLAWFEKLCFQTCDPTGKPDSDLVTCRIVADRTPTKLGRGQAICDSENSRRWEFERSCREDRGEAGPARSCSVGLNFSGCCWEVRECDEMCLCWSRATSSSWFDLGYRARMSLAAAR